MTPEELQRILASGNTAQPLDQSVYGAYDPQAQEQLQYEISQGLNRKDPAIFNNLASKYQGNNPNNVDFAALANEAQSARDYEYNQYMSTLTPQQQNAMNQIGANSSDPNYRNVRFLNNGTIIKSEMGGAGAAGAQYVANNPESDLWYGKYDPQGNVDGWTYQEGIRTTGNEYAPYFMAAGTLLTGGMLAPVIAGAGIAGGAAIGAGIGGASSAIGSSIANPGGGPDWGKVAMGAGTGAIGGALAGSGGLSGLYDSISGTPEFVMNPDTALAYGMEQYPSGWEGSIYGSEQGLLDATGSVADWAGGNTFGDFADEAEWADYWADYEDIPANLDAAVEQGTGTSLTDVAKKLGINAAKMLAKQFMGSSATQAPSGMMEQASSGTPTTISKMASGGLIDNSIDQKLLAYKLMDSEMSPEYWRFMSTEGEE